MATSLIGAVDGQAADVAAGKEQRRDHVRVGGDHHAAGRHRDLRAVVARAQPFVVERAHEELVDELRRGPAAAAMRHVDAAVLEIDGPDVVRRESCS